MYETPSVVTDFRQSGMLLFVFSSHYLHYIYVIYVYRHTVISHIPIHAYPLCRKALEVYS